MSFNGSIGVQNTLGFFAFGIGNKAAANMYEFNAPARRVPGCRSLFVRVGDGEAERYAQGERDATRYARLYQQGDFEQSYKRARAKVTLAKFSWDK